MVAALARRCVADALGLHPTMLASHARGARRIAFGRQLAMHLAHIVAGRGHVDVARAFGRYRTTAAHHFGTVEDLRDVVEFDQFIDLLEARFSLVLQLAELPSARTSWRLALQDLLGVSRNRRMGGELRRQASYIAETFAGDVIDV